MPAFQKLLLAVVGICNSYELVVGEQSKSKACPGFPTNIDVFSSSFQQPPPPLVNQEFKASWVQHKWLVSRIQVDDR
jgi:hypothetical protein